MAVCLATVMLAASISAASIWAASSYIEHAARQNVYEQITDIPYREVGLVLGTSPNITGGQNQFFSARIAAASELYKAGKIGHIIVSGSNPSRYYNEPIVMKRDLVELGVPADKITADYAGLRTLDSIVRADKVLGQQSFTVISQRFHAIRAVFLGMSYGLDVIAFCARDPSDQPYFRTNLREYGARFKALLDVWVLDTQPRYLGAPIDIHSDPATTKTETRKQQ